MSRRGQLSSNQILPCEKNYIVLKNLSMYKIFYGYCENVDSIKFPLCMN